MLRQDGEMDEGVQIYLCRLNVALLELLGTLFEALQSFDLCRV